MIWEWSATLSSPNSHLHIWQCVACSCLLLSSSVITIGSRQKEVLAYKKCSTTIITQQHVVCTNQQVLYSTLCAYVVYTSVYVKDIISTLYIKHMECVLNSFAMHKYTMLYTKLPICSSIWCIFFFSIINAFNKFSMTLGPVYTCTGRESEGSSVHTTLYA